MKRPEKHMELVATSRNGIAVYFDPSGSHTATHFADTPQLKSVCIEVIESSDIANDFMLFDTDLGRVIGNSDEVTNSPGDVIVYAKRLNRDVYTSFNKSKQPQPSPYVAVGLQRLPNKTYELVSAWIGRANSPAFPGDAAETPESKQFWMAHSLAWGNQAIQEDTLTDVCPW
jgi:hypothetical protein